MGSNPYILALIAPIVVNQNTYDEDDDHPLSDTMDSIDPLSLIQTTFFKILRQITNIFSNFIADSIYIVRYFLDY